MVPCRRAIRSGIDCGRHEHPVTRAAREPVMQLYDPKLKFARTLITHWSRIRRGKELVPLEGDLDPRELQRVLPDMTIMDISKPGQSIIAVMGRNIRLRYPSGLDRRNWYDFIPPEAAAASEEVVQLLVEIPCGVYYSYKITDGSKAVEIGEALALPMITHNSDKPTAWISVARIEGEGGLIISPIRLDSLSIELVDIGAGVPSEELGKKEST